MKACHCGCGRLNYYGATNEQRRDLTIELCYREPRVSMYDPIPKELLRNLPPWVGKLQTVAYLLMLPWALALVWILWIWPLGERMGLWHF